MEKGQIIGYLIGLKIKDELRAKISGTITGLLEEGTGVEYNGALFTITPTAEK